MDFSSIQFVEWYQTMADNMAFAQDESVFAYSSLSGMKTILSESDMEDDNVDRQQIELAIDEAMYSVNSNHIRYSPQILDFVEKIQRFIDDGYGDLNGFLSDNLIVVKRNFADISLNTGYLINESNIEQNPSNVS